MLSVDDLKQEGHVVALHVLQTYDPNRPVEVETVLTTALRRHFRRLIKRTLMRAFLYDATERARFTADLRTRQRESPADALTARVMLARLATLPPGEQKLAAALVRTNGRLAPIARRYLWSAYETRKRVAALRQLLTGERT